MEARLYYHIADVIRRCRTWIQLTDTERRTPYHYYWDGHGKVRYVQSLTLKSTADWGELPNGTEVHVPVTDLQRGIRLCALKDPSFRQRAAAFSLSAKDVNTLMDCATGGKIRLRLDDADY